MYQKMIAHTGNPHYYATLNNHIASVDVGKPEKEIRPLFLRMNSVWYGIKAAPTGISAWWIFIN